MGYSTRLQIGASNMEQKRTTEKCVNVVFDKLSCEYSNKNIFKIVCYLLHIQKLKQC